MSCLHTSRSRTYRTFDTRWYGGAGVREIAREFAPRGPLLPKQ